MENLWPAAHTCLAVWEPLWKVLDWGAGVDVRLDRGQFIDVGAHL